MSEDDKEVVHINETLEDRVRAIMMDRQLHLQ